MQVKMHIMGSEEILCEQRNRKWLIIFRAAGGLILKKQSMCFQHMSREREPSVRLEM